MTGPRHSESRSGGTKVPELERLQRWFQAVVTHPDGVEAGVRGEEACTWMPGAGAALGEVVTPSATMTAGERMHIYANAYFSRLLECMGEVYPVMKRVVGEEVFGGFAFGYLQQYPSRSYTLNELGRRFPQFLEATRPAPRSEPGAPASLPPDWPEFLVELARLEWGIYEVFDGPGLESKPPLGANRLKALGLNQWAAARLEPAPCLKLLRHRFPLNEFYSRARRISAEETPGMPPSREEWLALTRRDYVVRRHALERGEFELLSALCKGATVGEAIERVAGEAGDAEARWADALSRWFQRWLAEGFFAGLLGENGT